VWRDALISRSNASPSRSAFSSTRRDACTRTLQAESNWLLLLLLVVVAFGNSRRLTCIFHFRATKSLSLSLSLAPAPSRSRFALGSAISRIKGSFESVTGEAKGQRVSRNLVAFFALPRNPRLLQRHRYRISDNRSPLHLEFPFIISRKNAPAIALARIENVYKLIYNFLASLVGFTIVRKH